MPRLHRWSTRRRRDIVPVSAIVLQPSEERRKTGSHYTPRALTEPIVRTTLEPVLAGLRGTDGRPPRPEQILELKVCDPAMGSGAFLVEACRQLGDVLVEGWNVYGIRPAIPGDEDEVTFARRLVAQRCLYGVDRNAVAVDLSKMSLWLATLARELRSLSSTTPYATGIRSSGYHVVRSTPSTGNPQRAALRRSVSPSTSLEPPSCVARSARLTMKHPTSSCAISGTKRSRNLRRCGCSATFQSLPSSQRLKAVIGR